MRIDWSDVGTLYNEPEEEPRHNERVNDRHLRKDATPDEDPEPARDENDPTWCAWDLRTRARKFLADFRISAAPYEYNVADLRDIARTKYLENDMNDERAKRLRQALNNLVIQDAHAETCMVNGTPPRTCTCGYIERLAIARAALAADDDAEQSKPTPDLLALEMAVRVCVNESKRWDAIALVADTLEGKSEEAARARDRAVIAQHCAHRISKQLAIYPVPANKLGTEADLATRWRALLYAESRLQAQRDEIIETIEHAAAKSLRGDTPDGVAMDVPEQALAMHKAISNAVEELIADQVGRPSPDFRALLLNTRDQIKIIAKTVQDGSVSSSRPEMAALRGAYKEALRLTDVERLAAWPPWTLAGIALRHVVDGLLEELTDPKTGKIEPARALDDVWLVETVCDLRDARDKPDEYMLRKQTRKALGFGGGAKGDEHRMPSERDARDAQVLKDLAPSIVDAVRTDLKNEFPIPGEGES